MEYLLYLDRLKQQEKEDLSSSYPCSLMDIEEKELVFNKPIEVKGEAYVSGDHLIIHFSAHTSLEMPCAICNQMTTYNLSISDSYQTIELIEIKSGELSFAEVLRETILLELPSYVECHNGNCPSRPLIEPYLHKEKSEKDEDIHYPFSGLDNLL